MKDNLKLINKNSEIYTAFNYDFDEYNLGNVIKSFNVNTLNKFKNENFEDVECYIDDKYNYKIYFTHIDLTDLEEVNNQRNFINSINIDNNKININNIESEDLKWFSLKDIINNKDNFDKLFFKIFLKMIKNNII